ncbi:MAG: bL17 family ribosomal protein [Eubacteriales bacterium]|nr:bL17 family ribosomal protein [Eubacteriales bacterium]
MRKLNRPTDERMAVMRSLATNLLWYGKIETTLEKAKEVRIYAEKIITKAINTYEDVVKTTKTTVDAKGVKTQREVINDGTKKLAARRDMMSKLYDIQEVRAEKESKADFVKRTADIKHPLIEKIFNVYAPKYAKRKETLGTGGGYTRIVKLGTRNGDNAEMAIIELV